MNTRVQQRSRTFESANRLTQGVSKIRDVFGNTISNGTLQMIPDPFIRVQLRSIARKLKSPNAGVLFEPLLDRTRPVSHTTIPEQNKTSGQVPFEMFQELDDFRPTDVFLGMQPDVQINSLALWRYANCRNSRDLTPRTPTRHNGRLSFKRPSPTHRRDQRKSAFVEKDQRDLTSKSVFLYAAIDNVSSAGSFYDLFLVPVSQASGNSTPVQSKFARHGWDDTLHQNISGLPQPLFFGSTTQSYTHSLWPLASESQLTSFAAFHSALLVVPVLLLTLMLFRLVPYTASAMHILHLMNILAFSLLPALFYRSLATQSRAGVASQAAFGFHMVSYNHVNIDFTRIILLLRNSIDKFLFIGRRDGNVSKCANIIASLRNCARNTFPSLQKFT